MYVYILMTIILKVSHFFGFPDWESYLVTYVGMDIEKKQVVQIFKHEFGLLLDISLKTCFVVFLKIVFYLLKFLFCLAFVRKQKLGES